MMISGAVLLGLVVALLWVYCTMWLRHRHYTYSVFDRMKVPYVKPHPILGSLKELRFTQGQNSIDCMTAWLNKFGDTFGYFQGAIPTLILADLDMVHDVLVRKFQNFVNRPDLVVDAYPVTDTLVGLKDQRWKQVRAILAPSFSMSKMKQMSGVINKKIDLMFSVTDGTLASGENVEWYSVFQALTLDTISETALAMPTSCQKEQNDNHLMKSVREFLMFAINPPIIGALCFPTFGKVLTFISNTLSYSGRLTGMIIAHLRDAINKRRTSSDFHQNDVLQLLLGAMAPTADINQNVSCGPAKPLSKYLTEREVIANAWVFLLGGFETTSSAITYTIYLLAQNPEAQQRVFDEISSHSDSAWDHMTYDDVRSFSYLDQVLNESLRLYPPIVSFISRETKEDIVMKDVLIPKGMNVQIPIWDIHRDPKHWPDPETFNPERFNEEEVSKRHPMAYIPFGAGPRNCIGSRFALLEAKLVLSRLVLKYRFDVLEESPEKLNLIIPTVSINPKDKIYLKLTERSTG